MEDPFKKPEQESGQQFQFRLNKKFWLILSGSFVVLIFILLGVSYNWYFSQDRLISLAPVDSVLYVSVKDPIWPWLASLPGRSGQKYQITDLPVQNFYSQAESILNLGDLKFKPDILASVSQLSFVLLPNQPNNQLDWVFIFKLKQSANQVKIRKALSQLPNYLEIQKNIVAVATSPEAKAELQKVRQGLIFPLTNRIDQKKMGSNFLSLYLNTDLLKPYLLANDLSTKIFASLFKTDIYLNLTRGRNNWQFQLIGSQDQNQPAAKPLIKYLPDDFSFFISGLNLSDLFNQWGEADLNLKDSFKQTAENFNRVYQFDLANSLSDLLNQPAELAIFKPKNASALGFDYVLSLPKTQSSSLDNFEKLIKIVLAQNLPQKTKRVLPDGTEVIELQNNPEAFIWQSQDLAGKNLKYLQQDSLDFSIAYLDLGDNVLIGSSPELIQRFISSQDVSLSSLRQSCKIKGLSNTLIINSKNLSQSFPFYSYFTEGMILAKIGPIGLKGCILNN